MDQQTRLEGIRDRLVANHAMFASLAGLAFQESEDTLSLAIARNDPRTLLFGEEFISGLEDDELTFGVAHMGLRTILLHHERADAAGPGHDPLSLAQNYVANAMLIRDGIGRAPGFVPFRSIADADRTTEDLATELAAERGEDGGYVMHTVDGTEHRVLPFEMQLIEDDGTIADRILGAIDLGTDKAEAHPS